MWQCPRCETMNEDEVCYACGEPRPKDAQYQGGQANQPASSQPPYGQPPLNGAYAGVPVKRNTGLIITIIICITVILAMILGIGSYAYITINRSKIQEASTNQAMNEKAEEQVSAQPSAEPEAAVSAPSAEASVTPVPTPKPEPKETLAADSTLAPNKTSKTAKRDDFLSRAAAIEQYSKTNFETAMAQADLNRESGVVFQKWDKLLNDVYQYLKSTLPSGEFAALKKDEVAWVKEKEAAIAKAGAQWEGGSGQTMAKNTVGIDYTSKRCYYLITLIQ